MKLIEGFDKGFATVSVPMALATFAGLAMLVGLGAVAIGTLHAAS